MGGEVGVNIFKSYRSNNKGEISQKDNIRDFMTQKGPGDKSDQLLRLCACGFLLPHKTLYKTWYKSTHKSVNFGQNHNLLQ